MQVTGGARGLAPKRYLAEPTFLASLKPLFWANQAREADAYEKLIYALHPPAHGDFNNHLLEFRQQGKVPALGKKDVEDKIARIMRTIRYPDVEPLLALAGTEGLTLPQLTTILHFHHPAYPIYSGDLVDGLALVGMPCVFRPDLSEEAVWDYAGAIAAIDRLKSDVTFENVPESNCFLTRVVEGALVQYAREARDKPTANLGF
ncbi:MAG: hypothetical protein QOE90_3139 [Thermoplasmata archaeon]|jgi:hypothetical protein|nr:hypothetical protein [Thermoplasmata archaeon]